jgi:E3 ubiquitin-protein ligase HUWE1
MFIFLIENWNLEVGFSKSFLKHILNKPLVIKDLEDFNPEIYKSLDSMLNTNIESSEMMAMSYETPLTLFDKETYMIELKEGGKDIDVTELNKKEYIKDIARNFMTDNIQEQIKAFKQGLHDIIPEQALNRLNEKDLGFHLAGMPNLDGKIDKIN